jgi:hypothetical protein
LPRAARCEKGFWVIREIDPHCEHGLGCRRIVGRLRNLELRVRALAGFDPAHRPRLANCSESLWCPGLSESSFLSRRYLPAVRAFLDRRAGMSGDAPLLMRDGEERFARSR